MIDTVTFRESMARLGAAVNLVTTDGPAGRHGMAASAVCSVTDSPPTLLVCINRASAANAKIRTNGVLCINILAGRHEALPARFSDKALSIDERFGQDAQWTRLLTGAPVLADASVALDCRVSEVTEMGTHSVFFCQVEDALLHDRKGALIYFDRVYHGLTGAAA